MQEQVNIGMGRSARRVVGFDQINIVPSRRTRSSHDVDTTWRIDAYRFDIPFMAHPSDAVVTPEFAVEFGRLGGLPVINAEGLWGRHRDLEVPSGRSARLPVTPILWGFLHRTTPHNACSRSCTLHRWTTVCWRNDWLRSGTPA